LSNKNEAFADYCNSKGETATCGFPCVEPDITSVESIVTYLYKAYTEWNWLQNQFINSPVPIKIIVSKTGDSIIIVTKALLAVKKRDSLASYCDSDNVTMSVANLAMDTAYQNLPGVTKDRYVGPVITNLENATCQIEIQALESKAVFIGTIVGGILGVLIALLGVGFFLLIFMKFRKTAWIAFLPQELRDHWKTDSTWERQDENLETKELREGTKMWGVFIEIWNMLNPGLLPIESVYKLSNPILASTFANYREILRQRMQDNPAIFNSKRWLLSSESPEIRQYAIEHFNDLVQQYPWNYDDPVTLTDELRIHLLFPSGSFGILRTRYRFLYRSIYRRTWICCSEHSRCGLLW